MSFNSKTLLTGRALWSVPDSYVSAAAYYTQFLESRLPFHSNVNTLTSIIVGTVLILSVFKVTLFK